MAAVAIFNYSSRYIRTDAFVMLLLLFCIPVSYAREPTPADRLVQLGATLFSDPSLSSDGTVSCASCHQSQHAFTDGRSTAVGVGGHVGTRNTPSLLRLTYKDFFWDGRNSDLESLVLLPITNSFEMGLNDESELTDRLQRRQAYEHSFTLAFPGDSPAVSAKHAALALASYVRNIPITPSAYDRFSERGDTEALSDQAKRGLALFVGSSGCAMCHTVNGSEATFTDGHFHSTVVDPNVAPQLPEAAVRIMRGKITSKALGEQILSDRATSELGHFLVSRNPNDIGSFRTPSLRNVAETGPYMHDGSVKTIEEAVDREIYYRTLQTGHPNTLTATDRYDLIEFLKTLSESSAR